MRLLITGGSGLLGSKLSYLATQEGFDTYSGYNQHDALFGKPVKLDILSKQDISKTFNDVEPDVVVHSAAVTNVDLCEKDKKLAYAVNVEGTENIIDAAEAHNSFFIYVSTDYVFSGETGYYTETDETDPINYYGVTKRAAEELVENSSLDWCIARPSVIYGATPAAGKINFVLWLVNKLKNKEAVKIISDQWVSPTLNTNLAEMLLEIMKKRLEGIYHLAGATPINRYDFSTQIVETLLLDRNLIHPVTSQDMNWTAKRPINSSLDISKASKKLIKKPLKLKDALNVFKSELLDEGA